nr:CBS domain-containing protein [uncultured Sphingomonas sp.]
MTIAAILSNKGAEVATVDSGTRVADVITLLADRRIGAVPVMNGGEIVGIFSERDLVSCVRAHGARALEKPVDDVMSSPAITIEPTMTALAALATMTRRRIRHLPVVESGQIRGFVSIGDLVKYRIEKIEAEADAMRSYIQNA